LADAEWSLKFCGRTRPPMSSSLLRQVDVACTDAAGQTRPRVGSSIRLRPGRNVETFYRNIV
jgi:hypothetical protein